MSDSFPGGFPTKGCCVFDSSLKFAAKSQNCFKVKRRSNRVRQDPSAWAESGWNDVQNLPKANKEIEMTYLYTLITMQYVYILHIII